MPTSFWPTCATIYLGLCPLSLTRYLRSLGDHNPIKIENGQAQASVAWKDACTCLFLSIRTFHAAWFELLAVQAWTIEPGEPPSI